jgi:Phospholipase/Carboxylesterase
MTTLDGPRWGPQAGGAPRQLVVLCHGLGADGHDLIDLAPTWGQAVPHAAFAAPDAPSRYADMPFGRQWFDVSDRAPARLLAGAAVAAEALLGFITAELGRLALPADALALMDCAAIRRRAPSWRSRARCSARCRRHEPLPGPRCCWCTAKRTRWCRPHARMRRSGHCALPACRSSRCSLRGWVTASTPADCRPARCFCNGPLPI